MSNMYHHDEYLVLDFVRKHDIDGDICKSLQLVFDHDFDSFRDLLTNTLEGTRRIVWIFEGWLREQLRDDGKNCVILKDCDDYDIANGVVCEVITKNLPPEERGTYISVEGTSDLDALIKAHEEYKEIVK